MKKQLIYGIAAAFILMLGACDKSEIMYYEGGGALFFNKESYTLSFLTRMDQEKDVVKMEVLVMGNQADYDRTFTIEVIDDAQTTAAAGQYRIMSGEVPANSSVGSVKVEVTNPRFLDIDKTTLSLHLRIAETEHFKPGGWLEFTSVVLTWTTDIVKPETWSAMASYFTAHYSSNAYCAIIESTGLAEFYAYPYNDPLTGYRYNAFECYTFGKYFGDWIREYNRTHSDVYRHDDGDHRGEEIIPLY